MGNKGSKKKYAEESGVPPLPKRNSVAMSAGSTTTMSKKEKAKTLKEEKEKMKTLMKQEKEKAKTLAKEKKKEAAKGKINQRQQGKRMNRGRMFVDASILDKGDKYHIHLKVFDARDLMPTNKEGTADAHLRMHLTPDKEKDSKRRSEPVKGSLSPNFGTSYTWEVSQRCDLDNSRLHIQLWNTGTWKRNEFIGGFSFSYADILDSDVSTVGWFKLLDQKKGEIQNIPYRVKKLKEIEEMDEIYGMPEDFMDNIRNQSKPVAKSTTLSPRKQSTGNAAHKVSLDSFNFIKVLGQGAFGKVLMAEMKTGGEIYAVKAISKEEVVDNDDIESTMTERRVLAISNGCHFLTNMFATFATPERLYFVMEFITGGDLMFHLQRENRFPENQVRFYAAEILIGLWYLHKNGILYRDLKLDNVMLAGDGHVKIADFGMCKENLWGSATTTTFCGTPGYLAPEIVQEKPYNNSVDFWSLGVLCYEMMCGDSPFDGDDEEELFKSILESEIDFPSSLSSQASKFLQGLLTRKPEDRLGTGKDGINKIKTHPFFAEIDWEKAQNKELEPPYCPTVNDKKGAENFDPEYTEMDVELSPISPGALEDIDQNLFNGFSFVSPRLFGETDDENPENFRTNTLEGFNWYRPDLPRVDAVRLLKTLPTGAFIIRESGSQPGCFAMHLSLGGDKCWHGLITITNKIDGSVLYKVYAKNKFTSLSDLVDYYTEHPITKNSSGQKITLDSSSLPQKEDN